MTSTHRKVATFIGTVTLMAGSCAAPLLIAMDNSSSTNNDRNVIAKQCAAQFSEAVQNPKIDRIIFMTIGSAKNTSESDSKKIGARDYAEFMTRESASAHFKNKILGFPKRLEKGKTRLDNSSAIYNGVFNDAAVLLHTSSGASADDGATAIICSDFIENEIISNVTTTDMPPPRAGSLQNVRVYGVGLGLGLDSKEQNFVRDSWAKVMRRAGADFIPMKVR